ncbi:Ig-like domain-containing protein [Rhodococcus marinonascens]|uniref:Ig-like domain-containing protein n=1 Tax=Rhodococcus marinonascens TaxID=38311 RepID=UPI000933C80A|nr:Ig-like domain-containing protein [Rhodococcus marinonascens]
MSDNIIRYVVSIVSVMAVVAGFAVTVGTGAAGAASQTKSWTSGKTKFTRTISNVNPGVNSRVTVQITIEKKFGSSAEYIYEITDRTPTCWSLLSSKVDGHPYQSVGRGPGGYGDTPGAAKLAAGIFDWPIRPIISPKSIMFEFTYNVWSNCEQGVPFETGMSYKGSHGTSNFKTKGPVVTIGKVPTTTEFGDVPAEVHLGQSVPLTATVTGGAKGDTVEFYDGATKIGTAALDKKGVAAFEWTPDTAGEHTLSAKYLATSRVAGSQSGVQTVPVPVPDAETTTVLTGPSSVQAGAEVSFEAQISPTPEGGIVQFRDGDTDLGIPVPVVEGGKVSITRTFDSAGTHDITAVYGGAPGYVGSTSEALTVTVTLDDDDGDDDGGTDEPVGTGSASNTFGS